jgi:N-methylhydantoinase A/oxoprolinase/acetone carboxylase beta subunit
VAGLERIAADIRRRGLDTVAVTSVFSPVDASFERAAERILRREVPGVRVSLSHEIGTVGLLERENATVLNAALQDLADQVVRGFGEAVATPGITAAVFLSQNDGTLMSARYARRFPVAAIASGPTNSMRGAAFLSGLSDCVVIDIGGTTSDIGVLRRGFPREASYSLELAGVRTSFRMPDILSVALGGGSIVQPQDAGVRVGPRSVGYQLTQRARVFGGDTVTATDIAVATGRARLGEQAAADALSPGLVTAAATAIGATLSAALDQVKTSRESLPVVAVGGGSFLVGDRIDGAPVVRPEHPGVANAIGAAIAEVGGEVDRVFSLHGSGREEVMAIAVEQARARAIEAGALPDTVRIADTEDYPLTHLPDGTALRVRVKAVGTLGRGTVTHAPA